MATDPQPRFSCLSDEEFKSLTTEGRVEYLKRAVQHHLLNERIRRETFQGSQKNYAHPG